MSLGIHCSPPTQGVLHQEQVMGMIQPLTQKTEPQNFSRAADIAQGRRNGSSFLSLCPAETPGQMLGDKSPPTPSSGLGTKTPDDAQLFINSVLLHNPTNQSSDQKGLGSCTGSGEGRRGRPKKEVKGEIKQSHSHCRTPQPLLRNHSLDQCTPTDTNLSGPAKDITLMQETSIVRSQLNANKKSNNGWSHLAREPVTPAVPHAWEAAVSGS